MSGNIRQIATHKNAHVDELVGLALLKRFAALNSETAFVSETDAERLSLDASVALVGLGGGQFDEHKTDGRLPGECAATLIARSLGIQDRPELQTLLAEVLRADTEPGQQHLEWGEIIKTLHNYSDIGDRRVAEFVSQFVNGYIDEKFGKRSRVKPLDLSVDWTPVAGVETREKMQVSAVVLPAFAPVSVIFTAWLLGKIGDRRFELAAEFETVLIGTVEEFEEFEGRADVVFLGIPGGQFPPGMPVREVLHYFGVTSGKDKAAYQRLRILAGEIERYEKDPVLAKLFDFGNIIGLLNGFSGLDPEDIANQAYAVFDAYLKKALEFNELCSEDFKARGKLETFDDLTVVFVESDLRSMNAYCRTQLKAQVVVIRNGKGNVTLFTDHSVKALAWYVAEEILVEEMLLRGAKPHEKYFKATLQEFERIVFGAKGMSLPKPAGHWYFFLEAGMILNGSPSHPDVPPTKLSNRDLRHTVMNGVRAYSSR